MSVNVHLGVTAWGYAPGRAEAVKRAIRSVLDREDLAEAMPPLTEGADARGRYLSSRTDPDTPLVISGAHRWVPEFEQQLRAAIAEANGGPCEVVVDCEDADDEPDYEPE